MRDKCYHTILTNLFFNLLMIRPFEKRFFTNKKKDVGYYLSKQKMFWYIYILPTNHGMFLYFAGG